MTRLVRLGGRILRLELLPRQLEVARRWDGADQARPRTFAAKHLRRLALMARPFEDAFNGNERHR